MLNKSIIYVFFSVLILGGCGGGGNTTASTTTSGLPIGGSVVKGPFISGDVNVYQVNAGAPRTLLQSYPGAISNAKFNINLQPAPSGIIQIEVVNGTYTDEITGALVTNATPLSNTIDTAKTNLSTTPIAVTPLTTLVDSYASSLGMSAANLITARTYIEKQFGLTAGIETLVPNLDPKSLTATTEEKKAGLITAGLVQLAQTKGLPNANSIVASIVADIADGTFDGLGAGGAPVKDGNLLPIPKNLGSTQWLGGITQAGNSGKITTPGSAAGLLSVIASAVSNGTATGATARQQLLPSASGSVVVISDVNGKDQLVVAKGTQVSIAPISLDAQGNVTVGVSAVFPASVLGVGGAHGVVAIPTTGEILAYSNTSSVLTFINASNGAITARNGTGQVDTGVINTAFFSGGSGKIVGAVFDGHNGVWLATGDGYFHLNLATNTFDKKYYTTAALPVGATATQGAQLSENFGYDANKGYIYSPDYTQVQVIDVNKYTTDGANTGIYQMNAASYTGLGSPKDYDAGAVDASTGFSIAMTEWSQTATLIDLNLIVIDPVTNSFSLPATSYSKVNLNTGTNIASRLTGGVIEPTNHSVLWFSQGGNVMGVGTLSASPPMKINDWALFSVTGMVNAVGFLNKLDPHGIVATTISGKSIGLVPNSTNTKVAIIDINATLNSTRIIQAGGTLSHELDKTKLPAGAVTIVNM